MPASENTLAHQIATFEPLDGHWLPLEALLEEVFASAHPQTYYPALFSLFERYPAEDGAGVFWSALHGMEAHGGFEPELLSSYRRRPSEMTRTLLFRLRNAGHQTLLGVPLASLLEDT